MNGFRLVQLLLPNFTILWISHTAVKLYGLSGHCDWFATFAVSFNEWFHKKSISVWLAASPTHSPWYWVFWATFSYNHSLIDGASGTFLFGLADWTTLACHILKCSLQVQLTFLSRLCEIGLSLHKRLQSTKEYQCKSQVTVWLDRKLLRKKSNLQCKADFRRLLLRIPLHLSCHICSVGSLKDSKCHWLHNMFHCTRLWK